jgi:hypothetical protein
MVKRPQQPDDLEVAMAFGFQPAARPNAVEVSINVRLQQVPRRIARSARRLRLDPRKARLDEIKASDKGVDEPDRVVGSDVIVDGFRLKEKLGAFGAELVPIASL